MKKQNYTFPLIILFILSSTIIANSQTPGDYDDTFGFDGVIYYDSIDFQFDIESFHIHEDESMSFTFAFGRNLAKVNSDGTVDSDFGNGEYIYLGEENGIYQDSNYLRQIDFLTFPIQEDKPSIINKFLSNGELDINFGDNGSVNLNTTFNLEVSPSVHLMVDDISKNDVNNKIYLSVTYSGTGSSNPRQLGLIRLNPDGSPDLTLNGSGIALYDFYSAADFNDPIIKSIVLNDNSVILLGYTNHLNGNSDILVLKIKEDGGLDLNFGDNGVIYLTPTALDDYGYDIIAQEDGKIIIVGTIEGVTGTFLGYITRLNLDGSTDIAFGDNGEVIVEFQSDFKNSLYSIAIQDDGKILSGGGVTLSTQDGHPRSGYVLRLKQDGQIDNSFGDDGIAYIQTSETSEKFTNIEDIKLLDDGKIVIGGVTRLFPTRKSGFIARLINDEITSTEEIGNNKEINIYPTNVTDNRKHSAALDKVKIKYDI